MKGFCLLFLFVCSCLADDSASDNWLKHWKHNDIDEHVERPCVHDDTNCIRRFFAKHSHCKVAHGTVPDPFFIDRVSLALSIPNITLTLNNAKVKGLNGKVTEFTINKKTNNLVIAVEMRDVIIYSPKAVFKYHRREKEAIELADELLIKYKSIILTATIPNIDHLDASKIEVFAYLEDSRPPYALGPGVIKSFDMDVIKSFNKLVSNVPEVIKEVFLFHGPVFMLNFLQYTICDFGLKMIT